MKKLGTSFAFLAATLTAVLAQNAPMPVPGGNGSGGPVPVGVPVGSGGPAPSPVSLGNGPAMMPPMASALPAPLPVDAAKLKLAQEAMKAMQADRMLESLSNQIKAMTAQQTATLLAANPTEGQKEKSTRIEGEVADLVREAVKAQTEKMARVFAEVYTTEELRAISDFFSSPEGRSLLAKQPLLAQRLMPLNRAMQMELMPKIGAIIGKPKPESAPAPVSLTTPPMAAPAPGTPAPIKITIPSAEPPPATPTK